MIYYKIIIIDDDIDDRHFLMDALIQSGIASVKALSSAEEALLYLHEVKQDKELPKLIVSDLNMPVISGLQLIESLKNQQRYQHIPIIIFSTSGLSADISRCIASGAKDYIVKPDSFKDYMNIALQLKAVALS